jgi:hypothetical protein
MRYLLSILLFITSLSLTAQLRSPLAWYKFNAANVLADSSGNGYHLKAYGNASINTTYSVTGGNSIYLDGVNDYLRIPPLNIGNTPLISLWYYTPNVLVSYRNLIQTADADSQIIIRGVYDYGQYVKMYTASNSVNPGALTTEGEWHNLIAYFNKTTGRGRMWHDGVKVSTTDSTINTYFDSKDSLFIGTDIYRNGDWVGNIDEVLIYDDVEPTQAVIDSIFNLDYLDPIGGSPYNPPQFVPSNQFIGRAVPSYNGITMYMKYRGIEPLIESDTIKYYLSEDFENAWTTTTVQSKDSLERRLPMSWFNHISADHSIVDVGGDNNHVWQAYIRDGAKQGFQNFIHLGDTASELYYQMDLYVQSDFNQVGTLGSSGKFPGGFFMGNSISVNYLDTITTTGIAGHFHNVWGAGPMMLYTYDHDNFGLALGSWGTWAIPRGYWQTKTIRVNVGTPGNHDGFGEMYIDGVLVAQATGLKFRSITQGVDYGKIEGLWNSYQFGGSGDWFSQQDNYIRIDNKLVYKYNPSAVNYHAGLRTLGDEIPVLALPYSELVPPYRLEDETYAASSGIIRDVGNGVDYIYNPPNKRESIYKTVPVSNSISFRFDIKEFGYSSTLGSTRVKVYSGTKDDTLLYTFGIESGMINPSTSTWYTINNPTNDLVTFEIYIGYSNYDSRGIAIEYNKY